MDGPERLKILYLSPSGTIGGAEMCLLDLLAALRAAHPGWTLEVILGDDGPLRSEVEALDVPCEVRPLPPSVARLGDAGLGAGLGGSRAGMLARLAVMGPAAATGAASYLAGLRRRIRRSAPDLIQTNGMKAHVLGAWAAPKGLPVAWHLHDYTASRPVMARLLRRSHGPSVWGVAVSRSVATDAQRVLGPSARVRTIYNAVDLDRFAPEGSNLVGDLDRASGLAPAPEGTVRVGLVATFARWKGHEVFLEAAARVEAVHPCRFYVVGGPIYRSAGSQHHLPELIERARVLGLAGRIGFPGHQADPASALRSLDVVVHASTRPEPFGRVIVEAMACGRATIAAPSGGAAELFEDGVDALACLPGDPAALASAIGRLVDDEGLRRRLGRAGRAEAEARFDRGRLAAPWGALYEEMAGRPTDGAVALALTVPGPSAVGSATS